MDQHCSLSGIGREVKLAARAHGGKLPNANKLSQVRGFLTAFLRQCAGLVTQLTYSHPGLIHSGGHRSGKRELNGCGELVLAVHKPPRLRSGARIGVVAPAGCVERDALQRGIEAIEAEGFAVELGRAVHARKGYLAGEPKARAEDLLSFFRRPDIDAIFCARGGFGSVQLLPYLSSELKNSAKIFAGYSDITILLNWLYQYRGMTTFHAPMVAEDLARGLSEQALAHLWRVLRGELSNWSVLLETAIRPGIAEAELVGGCLSMLVTTLGTPFEIDTRGKLLFLEDIGEKPYRLERMLTHLKMAGKLDHAAGVVLGDFTRCEGDGSRELMEIIAELFHDAAYPVATGMKAGHGEENLALPIGARMRLDSANATLALLESPVS